MQMLYTNLKVTTNQKPVICKKQRKEFKYLTKETQQTMRKESKRAEKNFKKKSNKMALGTYLSINFDCKRNKLSNQNTE